MYYNLKNVSFLLERAVSVAGLGENVQNMGFLNGFRSVYVMKKFEKTRFQKLFQGVFEGQGWEPLKKCRKAEKSLKIKDLITCM